MSGILMLLTVAPGMSKAFTSRSDYTLADQLLVWYMYGAICREAARMAQHLVPQARWTHASVRRFAKSGDPVEAMITRARNLALEAIEGGWSGPPYDPFALAEHLRIAVSPHDGVADARTVPLEGGSLRIEYNPSRPPARVRYSIAHEIAHTLFPDCADRVQYRQGREDMRLDDWQLETLCNVGAAELLMPIGSLPRSSGETLAIDKVLEMRRQFQVSVEAVLLRLIRLTSRPCFVFACSQSDDRDNSSYKLDYLIPSRALSGRFPNSIRIPSQSVVSECIAIGYTAKGAERWQGFDEELQVEAVGVQPHPGRKSPRVLGIASLPNGSTGSKAAIKVVKGDATSPRGAGKKLILHVVNDKTPNWGGGFAQGLRRKWPEAQREFQEWVAAHRSDFRIGSAHVARVDADIFVGHLIAQKGYGPSTRPRIRYAALGAALNVAGGFAKDNQCSIHMPRIGCGQAGGSWDVVEELITEFLIRRGLEVTVYDLPNSDPPRTEESLFTQTG